MGIAAGRLKHRIIIQHLVPMTDGDKILLENSNNMVSEASAFIVTEESELDSQGPDGELLQEWVTLATCWAAIEPLSAREFIAASAEQSKVSARIVIRARDDIDASMRILHRGRYYNIEGILPDKDSGLEYITLPVSQGVRGEGTQA